MSSTDFRDLLQSRVPYVALMVIGAGLFSYFVYEDRQLARVRDKFEPTPCEIQSAKVEKHVHRGRRGGTSVSYRFLASYTYRVAGKTYTSSTFRHGDMGVTEQEAYQLLDKYEPGRSRCYVDPANPENAVLSQNSDTRRLGLAALVSILTMLLGLGGWVVIDFVLPRYASPGQAGASPDGPAPEAVEIPAWSSLGRIQANRGTDATRI